MKVLFMMNSTDEEKKVITETLDEHTEVIFFRELDEDKKNEALANAEIIIGGRLEKEQLKNLQKLKMHQTFGTGLDRHYLSFYKENGILLCNSHVHSHIIAEYGFSMMNAASKELIANDQLLREGIWDYRKFESVTLFNKSVLFLGYGEIAKHFKKMCKPFNMRFLAIKRTRDIEDKEIEVFLPEKKLKAIKQADYIFNSLPKTQKTIDFLNEKEFSIMKPSAIIINVGRGDTINQKALFEALKGNKIKGAAIDVWYNYPQNRGTDKQEPLPCYPSEYPFHELKNIIMTAHRAWVSDVQWFNFTLELIQNVNRFIHGEEPENIANLDEGY